MTYEEYNEVDKALDEAEEKVIPFPVTNDGELSIVGDANQTQVNRHDYTMDFRVPYEEDGKFSYKHIKKEYKNVFISPRDDIKINRMMIQLLKYYRKDENGKVIKPTKEESMAIYEQLQDEVIDAMYDVVASVLKIPNELKEYMVTDTVYKAVAQIIRDYPEAVNEADTFFG